MNSNSLILLLAGFQQLFGQLLFQPALLLPPLLAILDFVTGVLSAIRLGTFNWKYLQNVMKGNGFAYLVNLVGVFSTWTATGGNELYTFLVSGAGALILTPSFVASIVENCKELFGLSPAQVTQVEQILSDIQQFFGPLNKTVGQIHDNQNTLNRFLISSPSRSTQQATASQPIATFTPAQQQYTQQYSLPPLNPAPTNMTSANPVPVSINPAQPGTASPVYNTPTASNISYLANPNITTATATPVTSQLQQVVPSQPSVQQNFEQTATGQVPVPDYYANQSVQYPQ